MLRNPSEALIFQITRCKTLKLEFQMILLLFTSLTRALFEEVATNDSQCNLFKCLSGIVI